MESENNISKYDLYDKLRKLATISYEFKDYEKVQKILILMAKNWPERVIAKGKLASNPDVSDSELDTTDTIP